MSETRAHRRHRAGGRRIPVLVGFAAVVAFFLAAESLIQAGVINRFIVRPPSEVVANFYAIINQEYIVRRFLLTAGECLATSAMITLFGVAGGVTMQRYALLRGNCET